MHRLLKFYQADSAPGAAIMIIQDGQPLLTRTYGMADLKKRTEITPQTNFRLASVTKQFTATAIMLLQQQDKLDFSSTLGEVFPDFPQYGRQITIEHLLKHTSGLLAYENFVPDTTTVQILDAGVLDIMMQQDSTYFPPGTAYRYSNSGYAVLAMVVEKTSGKSFAQFLQDEIFHKLGMKNTVAYEKDFSSVPNRAYGYTVEGDSVRLSDQSPTSAVLGDGGIYSSLEDLFKWDQSLYTETLIEPQNLRLAFTPGLENYGYGWRIDHYKGHLRTHHTGSTRGFRNVIQRFPEDRFTVIVLTNRDGPDVGELAEKLTDIYLID